MSQPGPGDLQAVILWNILRKTLCSYVNNLCYSRSFVVNQIF